MAEGDAIAVSVVIPVYNESAGLAALFTRLYPALDTLGIRYEVVFVDDGSRDASPALLREQYQLRPDVTRVVLLQTNFGQHAAILAGFSVVRGIRIVTLDADLQNPPEEIARLLEAMDAGHDYVGSIRKRRRDPLWRKWASRLMNRMRERITSIQMTDQGCMLRAYSREIVDAINHTGGINTFIPALAYTYASNPTEVRVEHMERHTGESKYSLLKLIHLNFDLVTGFSVVPLEVFSLSGVVIALSSLGLFIWIMVERLVHGPDVGGVFTLFAILFFFVGVVLIGIGILGEYIGRIYQQVQQRPRFVIRAVLGTEDTALLMADTEAKHGF
ncbi:MAG TPA: glycosyltransferase [Rhodanobacteraceae bacterium]